MIYDKPWISRTSLLLLAFMAMIWNHPVMGSEADWHWVRVEPSLGYNPAGWVVLQGQTNFEIDHQTFTAKLECEADGTSYEFVLKGDISDNKIIAREVRPGTDAGTRTYHGFIQKIREPGSP